ncbi:type II secretion system protein [Telmatocola sphagniphila]|uniref:Type II secretion system protein n=1 Tax=Telmatocola sphagniphila TaxID=1123043 RepID=A0A8E6B3S2_9BACT|nr:type II secretion system protein [Telmatocola sphagniphila]QVL30774.1 type II secretion system protein [Telmatocola sphagniphila]
MRLNHPHRSRAAFTLIELLTVIGIITLLMGLVVGAVFRVQSSQQRIATETLLEKIGTAFDQQWKSVIETAKREQMVDPNNPYTPGYNWEDAINQWSGFDSARGRALWVRLRLFQEFPHAFSDVYVGGVGTTYSAVPNPATVAAVNLPATGTLPQVLLFSKQTYRDALIGATHLQDDTLITTNSVFNLESAVLLYQILSTSRGGMESSVDTFGANSTGVISRGGKSYTVFIDSWGMPIGFRRYGTYGVHGGNQAIPQQPPNRNNPILPFTANSYIGELSSPPFVRNGATTLDPLDPEGKLRENWTGNISGTIFKALQPDFYTSSGNPNSNANQNSYFMQYRFPNLNMGPIIFSAGPDKLYHTDDINECKETKPTPKSLSRSIANDDIISYRLRRTGQRGD